MNGHPASQTTRDTGVPHKGQRAKTHCCETSFICRRCPIEGVQFYIMYVLHHSALQRVLHAVLRAAQACTE